MGYISPIRLGRVFKMSKEFPRYNSHKEKKLSSSWRRPRGLQNKVRLSKKGYVKKVKIGYGRKSKEQNTIFINSMKDLESLDKGTKVVFSGKIGTKKKLLMLEMASQKGMVVTNVELGFAEKVKKNIDEKKKAKEELKKKKESKKEAEKSKKKQKEEKTTPVKDQLDEKEKKEQEKKEKDKLLTKKGAI
jgi:large subunit ribosomal protein L32e